MNLFDNAERVKSEIESTTQVYVNTIHDELEAVYTLASKLNSDTDPISDKDLEYILMDLPLKLFIVSEYLAKLSGMVEALKIENTQKELDIRNDIAEQIAYGEKYTQQDVKTRIDSALIENKATIVCLNTAIKQIEKQLTYCRELIMSAKKIWDARRRTENIMPVSESNIEDLPEITRNQYIK